MEIEGDLPPASIRLQTKVLQAVTRMQVNNPRRQSGQKFIKDILDSSME